MASHTGQFTVEPINLSRLGPRTGLFEFGERRAGAEDFECQLFPCINRVHFSLKRKSHARIGNKKRMPARLFPKYWRGQQFLNQCRTFSSISNLKLF